MYGMIPDFAKKILKGNPWNMDRAAIKKLSDKLIYLAVFLLRSI